VRFISVKNTKEIDKGKWVAIVFTFITDAAAVSIGILARYLFTEIGQDPESVLGLAGEDSLMVLLKATFPAFIVAIYIAIILSAIMSTIDSLLVVASSAITRDLYQKVLHPEIGNKDLSKMSARVTVIMALLALALAMAVAIFVPGRTVVYHFWLVGHCRYFLPDDYLCSLLECLQSKGRFSLHAERLYGSTIL
jgi:sodium/proline symporter